MRRLHDDFGVEVVGVDLAAPDRDGYPALRALFEAHSLLLFRGQDLDAAAHRRVAAFFGPIEGLRDGAEDVRPAVSNRMGPGALIADPEMLLLDLKANFLWHTDSTFLPTPSISNVLVACVLPLGGGGATEFVSTRVGHRRLPDAIRRRLDDAVLVHRFSHSRTKIDPRLGARPEYARFPDTRWRAVWRNPVNGADAVLAGAHACAVEGMEADRSEEFLESLHHALTPPDAVYSHTWETGDVLIWDQRAMLHRGTPWNYDEERTLASYVSSAREEDGIAGVRPPPPIGAGTAAA